MTRRGRATVTDAVTITLNTAPDVHVLDLWTDTIPDLAPFVAFRVEPRRWWICDGRRSAAALMELASAITPEGSLTPIGASLVRATVAGPGWRRALMHGGHFDAEDAGFAPGAAAATMLHHVPVWLHVVAVDRCDVYFAASYADWLCGHWGMGHAR